MFVVALAVCATTVSAQSKEVIKEQRAINRYTEKELLDKAPKYVRKEAKKLKKEGWVVAPGQLPLEKQLERAYNMRFVLNDRGELKYVTGDAQSIGENYDAAKMQALEIAKTRIAGNISTSVAQIVEQNIGNTQLAAGEAASVTEAIAAGKSTVAQKLGRIIVVVECYREVERTGNKEVRVEAFYDMDSALQAFKQATREELKNRGVELGKQLDELMGF